ncbi:MAG: malic enzyme-like NAD(P)-binding protein [Candidatus Paceibacterota bacterium]|jgi:malate dehydrogenase (oxaloacetate-decarboxylating)
MNYGKLSIAAHKKNKGKISVVSKFPLKNKQDLSIAYTPGVAAVSSLIAGDKNASFTHTIRANTVAVVSDGSAVLGLGNIGPEAAMPVMEGKAALFKAFAGVDAFPICLATQDTEEIITIVKNLEPTFGGINLEDISAPRCFEIEERLKGIMNIPVFHDDQHGTAIVTLAALINALKVVKKNIANVRVVINGAGAAAMAVTNMYIRGGVDPKKLVMVDSKGIINKKRKDLNSYKAKIAETTNIDGREGDLEEALVGADVFVGVSIAGALKTEWVASMADRPIVFAMANPNPEISYEDAKKTKVAVFGTGRSDYPNQINNVLAFPGIFRGALDVRAIAITEEMKLAAAHAIAKLVTKKELGPECIMPKPFDKRVAIAVAQAVKKAYKHISISIPAIQAMEVRSEQYPMKK